MVIQVKRSLEGLASNQSASMTMREGKIRDIYKLSLQKTIPNMMEITKEKRDSGQDGGRPQGTDC